MEISNYVFAIFTPNCPNKKSLLHILPHMQLYHTILSLLPKCILSASTPQHAYYTTLI